MGNRRARRRSAGFTLLEAMVALAIVALGMMAVNTQLNRYVLSAVFIEQKTLASWIASNVLTELSVDPEWPAIGEQGGEVEFAQRQWVWEAEISGSGSVSDSGGSRSGSEGSGSEGKEDSGCTDDSG